MSNLRRFLVDGQLGNLQTTRIVRDRAYAKRVPSSLTPEQKRFAVDSVRAGRSVHQVAVELSCAEVVVLELWMRAELRKAA